MNTQTIELDLNKDCLGTNLVRLGQGDKGGTTISALVYDSGAEAALSGYSAFLEVLLPNKANYYRGAASVSGNVATITVDESKLCGIAGYTDEAYFTFEKNGTRYSTERFAIEILRSATAGQQPAKSYDDALESLITRTNMAIGAANSAESAANSAARTANNAASSAGSAASAASSAATAANNAASSANTAKDGANNAASAANGAASTANKAAQNADTATAKADAATSAANASASNARTAASSANGAAEEATAAASNALQIANSIAASAPPTDKTVAELQDANRVLATALADAQDKYIVLGSTAYMPTSRNSGLTGETITVAKASVSTDIATLN